MAKVRYIPRSKEGEEHDAAGIAWMLILGIFILAMIYAILAYGIFGSPVGTEEAAAIAISVGALLVVSIVGWEKTKEPGETS